MRLRSFAVLLALASMPLAGAQRPVKIGKAGATFLGNTKTYATGIGLLPARGAYIQPDGTLSVTTETYPIMAGQSVTAVVSTDGFITQREVSLGYDATVGNNTRWAAVLGPYPQGTNVAFYLRANSSDGTVLYDGNGGANYEFTWRYAPKIRRGAILQWFATDYRTMMRRLPQVVEAGYGAIYLPPPQKSGGGTYSVGYNPFDRFDLGDRMQLGTVATRYGTTQELQELIRLAHRFGIEVYCDLVVNHNDNRASTAIDRYPDLLPEDFHIYSSTNTTNAEIDFNTAGPLSFDMLNHDLVGLADIAHEDGNLVRTGAFTLPGYATFDAKGKPSFVRNPLVPQDYPGETPVAEDVRSSLRRWGWFLTQQIGFDGFRIDAAKHTPPAFFSRTQTQAGPLVTSPDFLPYMYGLNRNFTAFGEVLSTNSYELREYAKTGIQPLDFTLVNRLNDVFNANGYGDMAGLATLSGIDSATGLGYDHGGLDADTAVSFVQSHDNGPPRSNNLATAFALTRPGSDVVYYDGNNLDPNDYSQFPRPGRFEALGDGSDGTTRLTDARNRFARGIIYNRYSTSDLFVYERQTNGAATLLVGLNDRGDTGLTVTVDTAFVPGTELEDLSGQRPNVIVGSDGKATITIPSNGSDNNARGYVMYAPVTAKPLAPISVTDPATGAALTAETIATPAGSRATARSYTALIATGDALDLSVSTTAIGARAYVMLDNGARTPFSNPISNSPEGLTDGFFAISGANGTFSYRLPIDALTDGLHLVRIRVFNDTGSRPGLFRDLFRWIDVRRGLGTGWTVDGDLSEFGTAANVFQSRTPSSSANRLDGLFVDNDDQYLYVGLAGSVDVSPGYTNGMGLAIDTGAGTSSGQNDLSTLNDDSGPAARLLSNTAITLPNGFNARYVLGSFRGAGIGSSPEFGGGGPQVPPIIGAFAGTYLVNRATPYRLNGLGSVISYQARPSASSGAFKGLEAAIPLRTLFPTFASPYQAFRFVAWLGTTGEAGMTLPASDPTKGTLGGRPAARSYLTNQFLPPQAAIVGDPGTGAVTLTSAAGYTLKKSIYSTEIRVTRGAFTVAGGTSEQVLTLTNTGAAITTPIRLMVSLAPNDYTKVTNRRGTSIFGGNQYIGVTDAGLAAGASIEVRVRFTGANYASPQVAYSPYVGRGAI